MLEFSLLRSALLLVSVALVGLTVGCREDKQAISAGERHQTPSIVSSPLNIPTTSGETQQVLAAAKAEPSLFDLGLSRAAGAYSISQTAKSGDDWLLVAGQYQDAIALMKQIDPQNPSYAIAQSKITEYQRRVQIARQKMALRPQKDLPSPTPKETIVVVPQRVIPTKVPAPSPSTKIIPPPEPKITKPLTIPNSESTELLTQQTEVYTVPIKRRAGGTPVIEVTFNGKQKFEMIVDTGASGTVITQKMALALPVLAVGKAKANTASSKSVEFPIGYVNSIEVGGVEVNRVAVAIAGAELETGLLGHDFFGNYDITIKQNVVEFRPHLQTSTESVGTNSLENRPAVPIYPKPRRSSEFP
jgi:predicted aspartyl protease